MTNKSINVAGIMIDADQNNFGMYYSWASWERVPGTCIYNPNSRGRSNTQGMQNILGCLEVGGNENTQFIIAYEISCPNKEEHVRKLIEDINKYKNNDLLPILISIGHEESPWNEDIKEKFSVIKEVENTGNRDELLRNLVEKELSNIKKTMDSEIAEELKVTLAPIHEENAPPSNHVSIMVLGGFMAALGAAAVAFALVILSTTSAATGGLMLTCGGVAALMGVGLFALGARKSLNTPETIELEIPKL